MCVCVFAFHVLSGRFFVRFLLACLFADRWLLCCVFHSGLFKAPSTNDYTFYLNVKGVLLLILSCLPRSNFSAFSFSLLFFVVFQTLGRCTSTVSWSSPIQPPCPTPIFRFRARAPSSWIRAITPSLLLGTTTC